MRSSNGGAAIRRTPDGVRVEGSTYTWTWLAADDRFSLADSAGRRIVTGRMQPLIVTADPGLPENGVVTDVTVDGSRLVVTYAKVNGTATMRLSWRFDASGMWFEPLDYDDPRRPDIVAVRYFTASDGEPTLRCGYLVQPGLSAGPGVSPIVDAWAGLTFTSWLGRGSSMDTSVVHQQWALPTHYFGGLSMDALPTQQGALGDRLSDAFCCGLADLPAGDLRLVARNARYAPVIDYRGDLWGKGSAEPLGATWYWTVARGYRDAVRAYYRGLVRSGVVEAPRHSPAKAAVLAASQYNTWGAQAAMRRQFDAFDERSLDEIYTHLRESGMRAGCFVIDDKWEGRYGLLEHSAERFPNFERTLARIRADGHKLGLWAAFLRCERPGDLGLDTSHMLRGPSGEALVCSGRDGTYYLFDITQPQVADALRERARAFARRYRPDLVKFDFGYELPSLRLAAPQDLSWAGERLLRLGLDIVVGAMRSVNPDLVVMYYSLSPLFGDRIDLHSLDDLWLAAEEYHLEANRRLFFSSLLGELGMPSYGSGGYDWTSMAETWFDTAASGSVGSLGSFVGDPGGSRPTPRDIAKYNGLAELTRAPVQCTVEALRHPVLGSATAARSSSWARLEAGAPVLVALRPRHFDGTAGVGEYAGVRTDVPVVVASCDDLAIDASRRIGVVPYGDGTVLIRHSGGSATVIAHCIGGGRFESTQALRDGVLDLGVREYASDGTAIEWVEVVF